MLASISQSIEPDIELAERLFADLSCRTRKGVGIERDSYGPGEQAAHIARREDAEGPDGTCVPGGEEDGIGFVVFGRALMRDGGEKQGGEEQETRALHALWIEF